MKSKVFARIKADPRVAVTSDETSFGDGVWIALKDGYTNTLAGCGTIHETSWTAAERVLRKYTVEVKS